MGVKHRAIPQSEARFYEALKDIFIGAKIEGESGYINLMRIKARYFDKIFELLRNDIDKKLKEFPEFRKELFDKLYSFFKRYFSESGSIYFRHTPLHERVYEKVYTDREDVVLFNKTHALYYVKTDIQPKSMGVEIEGGNFFFDVSKLQHRKAWEKRELIYELKKVQNGKIIFRVLHSERGRKTKVREILRGLRKSGMKSMDEETLEGAFRVFEKQNVVDYFISKNAKNFLKEQFDLWFYQYLFSDETRFTEKRIKQLKALQEISYKIIDFISQFEDELLRIWRKPKFVLKSNYVITLGRITEKEGGMKVMRKILKHDDFDTQLEEWKALGILNEDFKKKEILRDTLEGKSLSSEFQYLPVDTKYFKDLEIEILALFDNLDKCLDGWLIKSENWQALNTIMPKFKEKVHLIYIDPPFNTGNNEFTMYINRFLDTAWITMMENRLRLARDILSKFGSINVKCDYNGNMYIRMLMDGLFGKDNFRSEVVWKRFTGTKIQYKHFAIVTDIVYCYSCGQDWIYKQQFHDYSKDYIEKFVKYEDKKGRYLLRNFYSMGDGPPRKFFVKSITPPKGHHWRYSQEKIDQLVKEGKIVLDSKGFPKLKMYLHEMKGVPYSNLLTEMHVVQGSSKEFWGFSTQNPEKLIELFVLSSSNENDLIMDFFLGAGTTGAVAHKLNRKWIGVEMGEHFYTIVLPRIKEVLAGKGNHEPCGISKEVKWQGGGFVKYYELEQYEDTLRKVRYEEADFFQKPGEDPFSQYIFFKDKKLLDVLEIDYKNNKVKVDLSKLYKNIDVAETLSNLLGKSIKRITPEEIEFEDGEKIDPKDLDYNLIKPLIWW